MVWYIDDSASAVPLRSTTDATKNPFLQVLPVKYASVSERRGSTGYIYTTPRIFPEVPMPMHQLSAKNIIVLII